MAIENHMVQYDDETYAELFGMFEQHENFDEDDLMDAEDLENE